MIVELNHLPAQDDYYNAEEDQVAFVGGLGYGKTRIGADDVLRVATVYPRCGKGDDTPGIAICSNTYQQLIDGTMASFFDRAAAWGYTWVDKIRSEHKLYIPQIDAWIGVYSADDPEKFKSFEFAYIWIDEAQYWTQLGYATVLGRLRGTDRQRALYPEMDLRLRITANPPLTMDHWMVDLTTIPHPDTGKIACRLINASTYDNPFLPPGYIERLRGSYDPDVAEILLSGKYGEIGKGKVWRRFSRSKHVYSSERALAMGLPPLEYDPKLPLCWAHDFNIDPLCSILFQWRRVNVHGYQRDVMYVLDEMQIRNALIDDAPKELLNRAAALATARRSGIILYGDASGNQGNRQTGISDWAALIKGLTDANLWGSIDDQKDVNKANPERIDRYAAGNRMLEDADGNIGVVAHERCTAWIRDMDRSYFKPGTRIVEPVKYKDGIPTKILLHLSDAWSYPIAQKYPVELPA